MTIIQEQSVTLEACPTREDALSLLERAGRTCYKSDPTGDPVGFVKRILNRRHMSVIEHCSATMRFVTDRGVTHEMVRHRLAAYSQESSRYCNYSKEKFGAEIVVIPMISGLSEYQVQRRMDLYRHIERVYMAEIDEGIAPQQARDNLPTCLKTEIVMTANFREWLHVFELRTSSAAHPQMRALMIQAQDLLHIRIPELF